MELKSVKVSQKNHDSIRAIADKTGLGITDVVDRLIEQGLDTTKQVGKVVASDQEWVDKLQQQVDDLRKNYYDMTTRLDDIEAEVAEQGGAAVEISAEDLLDKEDHEPEAKVEDHTVYYCKLCASRGKVVKLDAEEQPDRCPECDDKLDWKTIEQHSTRGLGWIALGVLALAFVASRAKAVSGY